MAKRILVGVAAALVALLVGFLWGSAGKPALNEARQTAELRSDLFEAHGALQAARLDLYNANFGTAGGHLDEARGVITRAVQLLLGLAREAESKRLEAALPVIEEAQRLSVKLDLGANARAAEAAKVVAEVLQTTAKP